MSAGWTQYVGELSKMMADVAVSDKNGKALDIDEGFARWKTMAAELRASTGTVFLVGNGASASMASHYAADLAKNAHLGTQVFSDLSLLTAVANDLGYERTYAEPLSRCAHAGDMLVAISSSGKSPNMLAAAETALEMGVNLVTLSAMDANNPLRSMGALNFYVSATVYGLAETAHAAILHHWMDALEIES